MPWLPLALIGIGVVSTASELTSAFKYLIEINPGVEDILKSKKSKMLDIY